ncbi:MAG: FMN reductase [Streptosporangiales bacterium]|nr:FMN reductase [Streptosporangiales bacterium]
MSQLFVLGIGGTTRANSSTERALRIALAAAEREGAETLLLGAADLDLPIYSPEGARRAPAARRLVSAVRRCDGLIIGSPGYHGTISGLVKNALDYVEDLSDDDPPYLDGRAVGCLACAQGWQATGTTLTALRSVVHALRGWPTPYGAAINTAGRVFDEDGDCVDDGTRAGLELIGRQVLEFAWMRRAALHPCRDLAEIQI